MYEEKLYFLGNFRTAKILSVDFWGVLFVFLFLSFFFPHFFHSTRLSFPSRFLFPWLLVLVPDGFVQHIFKMLFRV